ncbi:MAG: gliding motility-associated C-terminal domain-containing protein [Ferruginibacter sp.]
MKSVKILKTTIAFLCLFVHLGSQAQVCTGSLGDPSVNVDFGTGNNPGNPLKSAITSYTFTSSSCPDDGSYTVVSSTAGCFNGSWQNVSEDHTPNDTQGYMMLVNASFTPGDFYVDTVKNLCANTTYEFAAWIMNVLLPTACSPNPIMPKLVFNIETVTGTILGTYSTGDIPSSATPTWKQYGLFFTTPANTNNVVIRLTNTAPGGCGNDLALDDITFRPCGPTILLSGNANKTDYDVCAGAPSNIPLSATIGAGYNNPVLQWQENINPGSNWVDIPGANSSTYIVNKSAVGIYKYRMVVADGSNITIPSCRVASNVVTVTIHDKPVVTSSNNGPVCAGTLINLLAAGGITYLWNGPNGFTASIDAPSRLAAVNNSGQYNVTATDQYGCSNTSSTIVVVNAKPTAGISSNKKDICEGDSTRLNATGGTAYLWSPASGLSDASIANPIASPFDTTTYQVVVNSANNCTDTTTITVNVFKKPTADAGPDKIILKGQSVTLNGSASGSGIRYYWTPSTYLNDANLLLPVSTPPNDFTYTLHTVSNVGCGMATDNMFIKVYNDIFIPRAFSPNNDGLNDFWHIDALVVYPDAQIKIFDRYGKLVFESTGLLKDWNGNYKNSAAPSGAYTYLIDLKNNRPVLKGWVMIVR